MDLQHIIAQKKELLVRETFSRQPINYSENMAADEKDRFIQYLVDKVNTYELDKRATELAVEEFQSTFDSVSASLESLKKEMEEIKGLVRKAGCNPCYNRVKTLSLPHEAMASITNRIP